MNKQSTDILRYPSFFKGVARVFDLFGTLDEYKYSDDPDSELTQKDWEMVGADLMKAIKHGKQSSKEKCYSR